MRHRQLVAIASIVLVTLALSQLAAVMHCVDIEAHEVHGSCDTCLAGIGVSTGALASAATVFTSATDPPADAPTLCPAAATSSPGFEARAPPV